MVETRIRRLGAAVLFTLLANAPAQAQTKASSKLGIDVTSMDRSVRPQDDFFSFVNGSWVRNTEMPADRSRFGAFDLLREQTGDRVRALIEQAAAQNAAPGSVMQKVGDYYRSFMDTARIEALGLEPLRPELDAIAQVTSVRDLPAAFARLAAIGVRSPLSAGVSQNPKNSREYIVSVGQSGLGLPDRDYYLREDAKFSGIRSAYGEYITQLLTLAGQPDPQGTAARIIALETQLAQKQWERARNRDRNATYNLFTTAELAQLTPSYDWQQHFSAAGIVDVGDVVVRQPDYLKSLDALITATPASTWREYMTYALLDVYASDLPRAFVETEFAFRGRVLSGQPQMRAREKRGVAAVERAVGDAVGKLYVEKHFNPQAKQRMDQLVDNLRGAFQVMINELEWMSPATKAQAQDKLAKFTVKIGYPSQWRDFSALEVRADQLIGNQLRAARFRSAESNARLGKPVERWRWNMLAQTVNASYSSTNNEITFPAGILQPPFFNVEADDAVNYGAIGGVIGHEISHGFDDQGRKSDGDGNLRDWWTEEDAKAFEARAAKLGGQFESYPVIDDLKINPRLTMGENIGDLSGLAVAYRAYRMSLEGKEAPVIDGFTGDQRFFMGWAQVWRTKIRDEALRNQLLTDSHSPGRFRAFVPLTNMDAFYEAFDVKPGDAMYRAPEERVTVW